MFDLTSVEEKERGNGGKLYIYPGVLNVVIKNWEAVKANTGTDQIKLTLSTVEAVENNTQADRDFYFPMSEGAQKYSMLKIKHIVTKVTKADNLKVVSTIDELAQLLNSITKNRKLRMKFSGEERLNGEGKVVTKALLGLPDFAEATHPGAEYEPVADQDSKLKFDPNNQYDLKKLEKDATNVAEEKPAVSVGW